MKGIYPDTQDTIIVEAVISINEYNKTPINVKGLLVIGDFDFDKFAPNTFKFVVDNRSRFQVVLGHKGGRKSVQIVNPALVYRKRGRFQNERLDSKSRNNLIKLARSKKTTIYLPVLSAIYGKADRQSETICNYASYIKKTNDGVIESSPCDICIHKHLKGTEKCPHAFSADENYVRIIFKRFARASKSDITSQLKEKAEEVDTREALR